MIISTNRKPSYEEFRELMRRTDEWLNRDASARPKYYADRTGKEAEDDVVAALAACARGTCFEGTIVKISGQSFPDIVAAGYYGVEVKTTKSDKWKSTGSSILESTRVKGVERIFLTFGKLGGEPAFMSRPYEECLYEIAVTHMPRYLIDMQIRKGETIFDKMQIPYEDLRRMDDPTVPVAGYYRSQLKPGERLWWTGENTDDAVSMKIRMWRELNPEEKKEYVAYGLVCHPEVFGGKYDGFALFLASRGVVNPHMRDLFSSGGKEAFEMDGEKVMAPAIFRKVLAHRREVMLRLSMEDPVSFCPDGTPADAAEVSRRTRRWIRLASGFSSLPDETAGRILADILKKK